MAPPRVVVLGGGLAGAAAAYALARAGWPEITVVERAGYLGGLAGTFERNGHFYPLAYHHILHRDRALLYFLDVMGCLSRVRWRKIRMLFRLDDRSYDLARPLDFMRFPMSAADKLRFVRMMLRSFRKSEWDDWTDRSGAELVERWAGPGVREAIFEPLCRLKFDLPAAEVSGAWLGARLYFREGSAPLGYVPGSNWTKLLCDGVSELLRAAGVRVLLDSTVGRLHGSERRIAQVELANGERLPADLVISAVPTEVYRELLPGPDATPQLESIRYTAVLSAIFATAQHIEPDFYWMNLASLRHSASGVFRLESLNPTIGAPGESCLNFMSHVPSRNRALFQLADDELLAAYADDFHDLFGFRLEPSWTHISRLPLYSPVFYRGYRNPPLRSRTWTNVYFAGNYRTFPSIASTGTALGSGLDAATAALGDHGGATDLPAAVAAFRLRSMPRG
jgi:protoporphyrinogen oxidase